MNIHSLLPDLSEVALFDEDCARKRNGVAAPGLVGREVRNLELRLKRKNKHGPEIKAVLWSFRLWRLSGRSDLCPFREVDDGDLQRLQHRHDSGR